MVYAKVSDINGKVYDVEFNNFSLKPNDLTANTIHRLPIRDFPDELLFIQGDKIVNIYIYEQDDK